MKKLFIKTVLATFIHTALSQTIHDLNGTWIGSYYRSLGKTGLRLKINDICEANGTFKGSVEFYPINSNKNSGDIELGKYNFTGKYKTKDDISVQFENWVFKAKGWTYVDKQGVFKEKNKITGKMLSETCVNFKVKRLRKS